MELWSTTSCSDTKLNQVCWVRTLHCMWYMQQDLAPPMYLGIRPMKGGPPVGVKVTIFWTVLARGPQRLERATSFNFKNVQYILRPHKHHSRRIATRSRANILQQYDKKTVSTHANNSAWNPRISAWYTIKPARLTSLGGLKPHRPSALSYLCHSSSLDGIRLFLIVNLSQKSSKTPRLVV